MCHKGVDLGHSCRVCGKRLLSCFDDGPPVSWHADPADAVACVQLQLSGSAGRDSGQIR